MKKVRLYENFHGINETRHSEIHKAAKQGSYPVTIVITNKGGRFDGEVAHQETVDTPAAVPAVMKVLYKKYATWAHTFAIEDATGKILFQEGLEVDEAYDGNVADFKYEFPQVFVDVTGNPEKAIKKIKKAGKGFEVRTSAYMSQDEMEAVGDAMGMVLVDYDKNSNMAISVFEAVSSDKIDEKMVSAKRGHNYFVVTKPVDISYIAGKYGMGMEVPGVLIKNKDGHFQGKKGAYIIDYFGAMYYVDMKEEVAIKIADMAAQKELHNAIEQVDKAPEHADWKDFLNESEDVNEARSIRKIQNDYDKVVQNLLDTKESWKDCKASGDAKGEAKCLAELKELTTKKKALISELDDAIGLKDVSSELSESLNESIKFGSYYFPKTAQDIEKILPEGGWKIGETKYAVICHNTVQMGKNIMYLKSDNSKIGQNFEAHILSIHNTEEEAFEAYKNAVKYDEGMTASCVSYAYGTLKSKGANYPFDEIGGERRRIK